MIGNLLLWLSKRADRRAERSIDPFWRDSWRRRAKFWADAGLLLDGLIGWHAFIRRRHAAKMAVQARWPT